MSVGNEVNSIFTYELSTNTYELLIFMDLLYTNTLLKANGRLTNAVFEL
jgi:hypothetical protein